MFEPGSLSSTKYCHVEKARLPPSRRAFLQYAQVEAGGIERSPYRHGKHAQAGQRESNPGLNASQPGHGAGDRSSPECQSRTVPGQKVSKAGPREAPIYAQQEQSNRITKMCDFPSDLRAVVEAWPRLPEAIKVAIGAMIGAVGEDD